MTKSRAILKTAAVLNAALLFGGYVWYRGGSTYADGPEPVKPPEKDDSPPVVEAAVENGKGAVPAKPVEGRAMMGGSKSRRVIDDPPAATAPRQIIMSGSKSEKLAVPPSEQKPRAMMPGSKVMVLDHPVRVVPTEAEAQVLLEALDDTKPAKNAVDALAPIQREKRVIMSGSKSAIAFPESSRQPEAKPVAQEEKPETPIRERMILLPGSKSSPFREFEENEARRKHLQQKQARE